MPPGGTVTGRSKVVEIYDKGPGRGAAVRSRRILIDKANGEEITTIRQSTFCCADDGFGGPPRQQPKPHQMPERAPDLVCDLPTSAQGALIYRLSGDFNPLHAAPSVAAKAGSPRPILHGLATLGVAGSNCNENGVGTGRTSLLYELICKGSPATLMQRRFSPGIAAAARHQ